MKIVEHPYLAGVLCRSDGAIFVPASGVNKAHWTFGTLMDSGYRVVGIARKLRRVSRLICETFHGLAPVDKPFCDHIDRDRSNNAADNLRWVDCRENNRNKKVYTEALEKYGVSNADDRKAYRRARWAMDPEYREKEKARTRTYLRERRKSDPEFRKKEREYARERYAEKKGERCEHHI